MMMNIVKIIEYFVYGKITYEQFVSVFRIQINLDGMLEELVQYQGMLCELDNNTFDKIDEKDLLHEVKLYLKKIYNDPQSGWIITKPNDKKVISYVTSSDDTVHLGLVEVMEYLVHGKISGELFTYWYFYNRSLFIILNGLILYEEILEEIDVEDIFWAAEFYNEDDDRVSYELDDEGLLREIKLCLKKIYSDPKSAIHIIEPDGTENTYYVIKPDDLSYLD